MTPPILVPIRRSRSLMIAGSFAVLAAFCLGFFGLVLTRDAPIDALPFVTFAVGAGCAALAFYFAGVALRAPMALRMDQNGISGYYAEPAEWREIKDIGVITGQKGHRFLGFALHDPIAFRDRQTAWRRLTSWSNGRSTGHHIVIPELILKDRSVDDLAAEANALHKGAVHGDVN